MLPVLVALVGGIIQFGLIFWSQNTLTQIVRDTGRWAATQQSCNTPSAVLAQANLVAANSSLLGYTPWTAVATYPTPTTEGVEVAWVMQSDPNGDGCPPKNNAGVYNVVIRITHVVPVFFPGFQYLPGIGTCDSSGCRLSLSTSAEFRMEPAP